MATKYCLLAVLAHQGLAEPADVTKGAIRTDESSWNKALFGPYNPDDIESAPLQHVLLEQNDIGFVIDPFGPTVNPEAALHRMSVKYGEEDIIYQLDFNKNGFNGTETFAILQNGVTKCKTLPLRHLAPASGGSSVHITTTSSRKTPAVSASPVISANAVHHLNQAAPGPVNSLLPRLRDSVLDDLRIPPMRAMQEATTEVAETLATEANDFLGGTVDIMFVAGTQIKLTADDYDTSTPVPHPANDHVFALKGRFVQNCECSHSHVEDTAIGLGKTRFVIRKLHVSCPDPVGYKQVSDLPTEAAGGMTSILTQTTKLGTMVAAEL